MSTIDDREEAVELRDKIWVFAQRGVLALVVFFGGVFAGYQMWGEASKLRQQVEELNEKNASLVKERDTLRSKIALVERDKNQAMKTAGGDAGQGGGRAGEDRSSPGTQADSAVRACGSVVGIAHPTAAAIDIVGVVL